MIFFHPQRNNYRPKMHNQNSYLVDTNYVPQNEGDVAYIPSAAGGSLDSSMQTIPTLHNFRREMAAAKYLSTVLRLLYVTSFPFDRQITLSTLSLMDGKTKRR